MRRIIIGLMICIGLLCSLGGGMKIASSVEGVAYKKLAAQGNRLFILHRETRLVRILDNMKPIKQFEILSPYSSALPDPVDIACDNGILYVLDAQFCTVWCYSLEGNYIHPLEYIRNYLHSPSAIYAKDNRVFIADTGCIWQTDELGHALHRILLPADSSGTPTVVSDITQERNLLYAVDRTSARIFVIELQENDNSPVLKETISGYGYEKGRFIQPTGIAVQGCVFVSDFQKGKIGKLTRLNLHTREAVYIELIGETNVKPGEDQVTDILLWNGGLWFVNYGTLNVINLTYPEEDAVVSSINVIDFGSSDKSSVSPKNFTLYSKDGFPISGTLACNNPLFRVYPTHFEKVNTMMFSVSPELKNFREGARETGIITVTLQGGTKLTVEVRAKKKADKDFTLFYPGHADVIKENNTLPVQVIRQNGLEGNLEYSVGKTEFFTFSWALEKMPLVNDRMHNSLIVLPIGKPEPGFYSVAITIKCPEEKLVKPFTLSFLYKAKAEEVGGTILGEYFSAEWCPYCPSGSMALPELHQIYSQEELVFLTHYIDCTKDAPERLCFPENDARMKMYSSVGLHPALFLNGTTLKQGGYNDGVTTMTREYRELIEELSPMKSPISLTGSANWNQDTRELMIGATVQCLREMSWQNPRLYAVLAEDGIEYNAKNGLKEHHYVVRDFLSLPNPEGNDALGSTLWGTDGEILTKPDDRWQGHLETMVEPFIDMEKAFVVLFVQDNETKLVYQARYIPLGQEPRPKMDWVLERKTVRLNQDQTSHTKAWLVNRGDCIERFDLEMVNRKDFFGEDFWIVEGNEYPVTQSVSILLNPMESALIECIIKPIWGKPALSRIEYKAMDSKGNEALCRMNVVDTTLQPRYELIYPDPLLLEENKGWQTDLPKFSCILRTEPGTVLYQDESIKAGSDGLMVIPDLGKGECYGQHRRSMTLQYPDSSLIPLTFFYEKTLVIKLTIGSKLIQVNREIIEYEAAPFIMNSRTMVPIRIITESLVCGAKVDWDVVTREITVHTEDKVIIIKEGRVYALVNGKQVPLDAPPVNRNGRVFLPLRFFAEELGAVVAWDGKKQEVTITRQET